MRTPHFKVVTHRPWRRPVVLLVGAVLTAAALVAGYMLGYRQVMFDATGSRQMADELVESRAHLEELEAQLIDVRLTAQVQGDAANALRKDLSQARQRTAKLEEELTFYKSLMAPGTLPEGLQIAELDIVPTEQERAYDYQMLLTQVALRRSYIAGEVKLELIGRRPGRDGAADSQPAGLAPALGTVPDAEVVLPLTELSQPEKYPFKFRFRYFQDLAGRLTLPDGFEPIRVRVTAAQKGEQPVEAEFPWPQF